MKRDISRKIVLPGIGNTMVEFFSADICVKV
jgi:hypothetical protein